MKRFWLLLFCIMLFTVPACAQAEEDAVIACLQTVYPQADVQEVSRWGNTAAAAFTYDQTQVLCVLEYQNGQWTIVVNSGSILLQEEALPSLLVEEKRLFWSYDDWLHTSFDAYRAEDGLWYFSNEWIYEDTGNGNVRETMMNWRDTDGGRLVCTQSDRDADDNAISVNTITVIPAMWMADRMALSSFDIHSFPLLEALEYDGQWPGRAFIREAAAYLMPSYTFVGGSMANGHLQFLVDKPDGSRVFVGCVADDGVQLTESTPLPKDTRYGVENFTNALNIHNRIVLLRYFPENAGWGVRYVMTANDEIYFYTNYIRSSYDPNTLYFGSNPWNHIEKINWNTLPQTLVEAADSLDGDGWAIVDNPDPADRLHLRVEADRGSESMGKYYNGTPVRILDTKGDWVQVDVCGQIGWMMKRYLCFTQPYVVNLSGMPQVRVRYQTASVYEAAAIETEKRAIRSTYSMAVIGILDDTWYHVWFPLTGETGYVLQRELI